VSAIVGAVRRCDLDPAATKLYNAMTGVRTVTTPLIVGNQSTRSSAKGLVRCDSVFSVNGDFVRCTISGLSEIQAIAPAP
jgi:hypothetical protein